MLWPQQLQKQELGELQQGLIRIQVISLPQFKYCILQTEKLPPLKEKTEALSKYSKQCVFHKENNEFNSLKHLKYFSGQLHSYYQLLLLTSALSRSESSVSGKMQQY